MTPCVLEYQQVHWPGKMLCCSRVWSHYRAHCTFCEFNLWRADQLL